MQTINHFFNLHDRSTDWVSRIVKSQEFSRIKRRMAQELKGFRVPPSFYELVIRQLTDMLDINISYILIQTWCKHREIIQYRDTDKYPPGEVFIVPLIEHTVSSRHSPTIQPIINNVPLSKIKFDVVLRLKMKGVMLKILDGKITEILIGSCAGNGSIEYAGFAVLEKETAPITFPASIVLKEGVRI
jgi:hypothetical protein